MGRFNSLINLSVIISLHLFNVQFVCASVGICHDRPIDFTGFSFICQGTSTKRQRSDLFGLRVKLPPVTTSQTSDVARPLS